MPVSLEQRIRNRRKVKHEGGASLEAAHKEITDSTIMQIRKAVEEKVSMSYYIPIVFSSQDQCDAFITAMGWDNMLDESKCYLDGNAIARTEGVALPVSYFKNRKEK
jgi:hypothetical protein